MELANAQLAEVVKIEVIWILFLKVYKRLQTD